MRTAMGCYVLSGEHSFSKEQEEMHVECSSGINGRPRHGGTRWHESDLERQASSWTDDSRCVEVTQRAVFIFFFLEEESQRERHSLRRRSGCENHREASSDTLCVGGVLGVRRGHCAGQQQ